MLRLGSLPYFFLLALMLLISSRCDKGDDVVIIVPQAGYAWPENNRAYWPTAGWETASPEAYGLDPAKLEIAHQFAQNDPLARALLVVKDGYLVHESYYGSGAVDASTNLWSCTKSFASALVGLLWDRGDITSTDVLMSDLLPQYPQFNDIKLQHVLTHTTGLSWTEQGPLWVEWIFSDDWVAHALERGHTHAPGERFYYSSGNTHFLTALVYHRLGGPGHLAKEHLFDPMGIQFNPLETPIPYTNWSQYIPPLYQSWRQDPQGIECASFSLYLTAHDMAKFGYLYLNRGRWEDRQLLSEDWVLRSTRDHKTNIYGRYSYGYQWYLTKVAGHPAFLASGFGGQIIGVVPSQDLVVVLKYDAENPEHPKSGTAHDDMHLFELVVRAVD